MSYSSSESRLAGPGARLGRWPVLAWLGLVAAIALALSMLAGRAEAQGRPDSFADLADRLLPAVVNISTTQGMAQDQPGVEVPQFPPGSPFEEFFRDFFDRRNQPQEPRRANALGSGFIIDADGHVVTNYHVIEGADQIDVILQDNTSLRATLVGWDDKTDIAVLKVDPPRPLPALQWGNSETMRVGDWVLAIGNPFGLGGTVTAGIISARQRDINAGPYDDFIQTDASINRGNSGGPMFDLEGHVIGINTAIYSPSGGSVGIGFAIPSALARPVVEQIIEFGRTRRGWLGVRIQTVTDEIAESLAMEQAMGALVASVTEGGPAAAAGIRPGDVIIAFDGRPIEEMRRLPRIVAETPVNKQVQVTVWRDGQRVDLPITLGELEEAEEAGLLDEPEVAEGQGPAEDLIEGTGLTVATITDDLRIRYGLTPDATGVVVTEVAGGSDAAAKGIAPGSVIVEVAQQAVTRPSDVEEKVEEARRSGRRSVLLLVDTAGDLRFVALQIAG